MAKRLDEVRRMTIEEFLAWDDGTDTRYELERGVPVAMNPPMAPHARIAINLGTMMERMLARRRPCRALAGAGVVVSPSDQSFYVPDLLVTCEEPGPTPYVAEPRLVVEILSPSTERLDKTVKVPAYGRLPTVEEIWLVSAARRWVLVWRKVEGSWIAHLPYEGDATFPSPVLGGEVALERLYDLSGV
jgi:Uma2 family endonuclease